MTMVPLSVHYEHLNSALWSFHCSPVNIFVLSILSYEDDLAEINRAWLYKDLKVQAYKLAQSGWHERCNTRGLKALGSQVQSPLEVAFCWIYVRSNLPYVTP